MIGKQILHYKILEELGRGGMGVVYKAEDTKLKRDVAIKFLPHQIAASEEERTRFKIEAQAAAALNHPNIATIYAIEEVDDEMFIVMEYIEGRELKEIVGATGRVAPTDAIDYATQIASGLQAAHEKDVAHRDIKSANIMITDKGQVKIIKCDEHIVMPNHFHAVMMNVGADLRVCPEPDTHPDAREGEHIGSPLPTLVQWFKTITTNEYIRGVKQHGWPYFPGKLWQGIILIA